MFRRNKDSWCDQILLQFTLYSDQIFDWHFILYHRERVRLLKIGRID